MPPYDVGAHAVGFGKRDRHGCGGRFGWDLRHAGSLRGSGGGDHACLGASRCAPSPRRSCALARVRFRTNQAFPGMESSHRSRGGLDMRRSVPFWSAALAAAPLAISHVDSSVTELRVAWGSGSYADVSRGCDNSVISAYKINYDNVGADVSHKFTIP